MTAIARRIRRATLIAGAGLAAFAGGAQAVHWPLFGGDSGRSGYQPVQESALPLTLVYAKTAASDQFVKTSVLTSTGAPDAQRVIYGTVRPAEAPSGAPAAANGRVHLRVLGSGAAVGPEEGVPVDDGRADADVFGPGAAAPRPSSVAFADTSSAAGLGQVFALHNDDDQSATGDIALAQIDETDGAKVADVPLAGTEGYSVLSSPTLTGADSGGGRVLFFLATDGTNQRLFRVPIARAGARDAALGAPTATADIDADPQSSPTLMFLRNGAGAPTAHVAVGTTDGLVRTYAAADLAAGPVSAPLGGPARTPSVPVTPAGNPPGPGAEVTSAPVVYVAAATGAAATPTTTVHALVQEGNAQTLAIRNTSPTIAGAPAPALATEQTARAGGPEAGSKIIVTTGRNLVLLDAGALGVSSSFDPEGDLAPGTTGFGQTTAAASGDLLYVTTDEGEQLALRLSDAKPVARADFAENAANGGDRLDFSGMGQPSISRGFVQFGSQKGLFVYRGGFSRYAGVAGADGPLFGTRGDDVLDGAAGDERASGLEGADIMSGGSGADRLSGGPGTDTLSGAAGDDYLLGGADRDRITGDVGNDRIDGQAGSNIVDGGIGADRIRGGERADSLNGGSDEDVIYGGAGNDGISGASGRDRLYGEAGNDRIEGGLGQDAISGGDGNDNIVSIDGQPDRVRCGAGRDVVRADGGDIVSRDCELVIERPGRFETEVEAGGGGQDLGSVGRGGAVLTGSGSSAGELRGSDGSDTLDSVLVGGALFGLAGSDLLSGGSGDDRAEGGPGIDVLTGGPGADVLLGGEERDFADGGPGADRLEGGAGSNVLGGALANDSLVGGELSDSLNGGSDEDRIFGGAGNDGITGASGNDRLFGQDGDDRIEGGLGRDVISGGAGGDNVVVADGQVDRVRCGAGDDVVRADAEDRVSRDCELLIARRGKAYVVVRR